MDMVVCAVFDTVAKRANEPFVSTNIETAVRLVRNGLLNNPGLQLMASDLQLVELAVWSPERCRLEPVDGKPYICFLNELLPSLEAESVEEPKSND